MFVQKVHFWGKSRHGQWRSTAQHRTATTSRFRKNISTKHYNKSSKNMQVSQDFTYATSSQCVLVMVMRECSRYEQSGSRVMIKFIDPWKRPVRFPDLSRDLFHHSVTNIWEPYFVVSRRSSQQRYLTGLKFWQPHAVDSFQKIICGHSHSLLLECGVLIPASIAFCCLVKSEPGGKKVTRDL